MESDAWLGCTAAAPVLLETTVVPSRVPAPKELLALQPLPTAALLTTAGLPADFFGFAEFNALQTQVYKAAYEAGDALLVAPWGSARERLADELTRKYGSAAAPLRERALA